MRHKVELFTLTLRGSFLTLLVCLTVVILVGMEFVQILFARQIYVPISLAVL